MWQQYGIHIIAMPPPPQGLNSSVQPLFTVWYQQLTIYCHLHRSGLNGDVITQMTVQIVPVPAGIIGFVPHKEIWQAEVWVVALCMW